MSIIRLEKLLKSGDGGTLEKVVQNAQLMEDLTLALKQRLEPDMAENVVSAGVRDDGDLVVIASSSAWASRLRFESDQLLAAARKMRPELTRCRIRVASR